MSELIKAHTNLGIDYPGFINFSREGDKVLVTVRGDPISNDDGVTCGTTVQLTMSAVDFEGLIAGSVISQY